LRNDGWWLRGDIIWAKKNPLPESVRDALPDHTNSYSCYLSPLDTTTMQRLYKEPVANPDGPAGIRPVRSPVRGKVKDKYPSGKLDTLSGYHWHAESAWTSGTSQSSHSGAATSQSSLRTSSSYAFWQNFRARSMSSMRKTVGARAGQGQRRTWTGRCRLPKTKDLDDQHGHKRLSRRIIAAGKQEKITIILLVATGPWLEADLSVQHHQDDTCSGTRSLLRRRHYGFECQPAGRNFVGIDLSEKLLPDSRRAD